MPREVSTKPHNVRNRMRRKVAGIQEEIERLKPLEEWDWEELCRGYPKRSDGTFGRRPAWAGFHIIEPELQRRLTRMTSANLKRYSRTAVAAVVQILTNDETDIEGEPLVKPETRLKAAQFIIEHTIGKPQANVQLDAGEDLKSFLAAIMVNDDGEDAHPMILPGAVLSDEEDDD
jgi:hypothetical protein